MSQWRVDPISSTVVVVMAWLYWQRWWWARRRGLNSSVWRLLAFLSGLTALIVAADSPIGVYEDTLLSAHMVGHLLLLIVAPALLALGAPVTLLLQTSSTSRRQTILRVLRTPAVAVFLHPGVAVNGFLVVLFVSHFTPFYDAALRNTWLHGFEHAMYATLGLLLWIPIVAADPMPHRLSRPIAMLVLGVLGPYMAILGIVIFSADAPVYATHAARTIALGIDPLADQRIGAAVMWFASPALMFPAFLSLGIAWSRQDDRRAAAADQRHDRRAQESATMTPVWWREASE